MKHEPLEIFYTHVSVYITDFCCCYSICSNGSFSEHVKHYKIIQYFMNATYSPQSYLIMMEWGVQLTFEIQTFHTATYTHSLLRERQRGVEAGGVRKRREHACTPAHTHAHARTLGINSTFSTIPGLFLHGLSIHATLYRFDQGGSLDARAWIMNFTQFTAAADGDTAS